MKTINISIQPLEGGAFSCGYKNGKPLGYFANARNKYGAPLKDVKLVCVLQTKKERLWSRSLFGTRFKNLLTARHCIVKSRCLFSVSLGSFDDDQVKTMLPVNIPLSGLVEGIHPYAFSYTKEDGGNSDWHFFSNVAASAFKIGFDKKCRITSQSFLKTLPERALKRTAQAIMSFIDPLGPR